MYKVNNPRCDSQLLGVSEQSDQDKKDDIQAFEIVTVRRCATESEYVSVKDFEIMNNF